MSSTEASGIEVGADDVRTEAIRCIRENDHDGLLSIKDELAVWGARFPMSFSDTLAYACGLGRLPFVQTFLSLGVPLAEKGHYSMSPLRATANKGFEDIFELIYPLYDKLDLSQSDFLLHAISGGSLVILKAALTRPERDPRLDTGLALTSAVSSGKTHVVRFLLPFVDPKAKDSRALLIASERNLFDIFNLLYPLSDPLAAMKACEDSEKPLSGGLLFERVKAEQSKKDLEQSLSVADKRTPPFKKM